MDTAHRRMEIISILSVKGHITARELAWELGVTIRTIHHDIFALFILLSCLIYFNYKSQMSKCGQEIENYIRKTNKL